MTEQKNKNFFCIEPYKNISSNTEGHWKACCISNNNSIRYHNMTVDSTKVLDFYNSDFMNKLRHDQKNGIMSDIVTSNCEKCLRDEELNRNSRRINQNKKYSNVNLLKVELDSIKIKHIGNLCNAKCITCYPLASSLFAQESKELGEYSGEIILKETPTDTYLEGLKEAVPYIGSFRFSGGEPVVNKLTWEFIEWLVKEDATDIQLTFTTNGKVKFKPKQEVLLSKFKKIKLAVSLDGYGEKNFQIRFPINYNTVIENIKSYSSITDHINIITTVSNLNVGYLDELGYDLKKHFNYPWSYNNYVTKPNIFNPNNLPNQIKQNYIKSSNIAKNILSLQKDFDIQDFYNMLNFVVKRDKIRGTNIFNILPEFKKFYKDG
tara:strand:+ start:2211 stop:3341 length:1131 start_codon:yes stop_codon:yes gene_type:complete